MAKKYKVLGDVGVEMEILGATSKAGDILDLEPEQAQPLVDEEKLEAVEEEKTGE